MNACSTYTLACLVSKIIQYLQIGIMLIISLAVVTFVWNIYRYFFTEKDKKEAGMYVLYSVIGFFVILSFWGLVAILTNTLNLPNSQPPWWPFSNMSGGSSQSNTLFNGNAGTIPAGGNNGNAGNTIPTGSNTGNYTDTFGGSHQVNQ